MHIVSVLRKLGFLTMIITLPISTCLALNYYVDDLNGDDAKLGTSPETAWKTLANPSTKVFSPGDSILFKAGGSWSGELRNDGGATGTQAQPVVFDKYGPGKKPLITGTGSGEGSSPVTIRHNDWYEFNNFELTNPNGCTGIKFFDDVPLGRTRIDFHVAAKNLTVHNVNGSKSRDPQRFWGGIIVKNGGTARPHITLRNCTVYDIKYNGMELNCYYKGTKGIQGTESLIDSCTVYNCGANGILFGYFIGGGISNCVIYNCGIDNSQPSPSAAIQLENTTGTLIQNNELYNNKQSTMACDIDAGSDSEYHFGGPYPSQQFTVRYNYLHDNLGGLLDLQTATPQQPSTTQSAFCYNVCQNNGGVLFRMGTSPANSIFNNTIFNASATSPSKVLESGSVSYNNAFTNNIIVLGSASAYDAGGTWNSNCFSGAHATSEPTDPHKITADPLLKLPGSGATGFGSIDGYALQATSPCINTGTIVANAPALDIWGHPANHNGKTNIGADQGIGNAVFAIDSRRQQREQRSTLHINGKPKHVFSCKGEHIPNTAFNPMAFKRSASIGFTQPKRTLEKAQRVIY